MCVVMRESVCLCVRAQVAIKDTQLYVVQLAMSCFFGNLRAKNLNSHNNKKIGEMI